MKRNLPLKSKYKKHLNHVVKPSENLLRYYYIPWKLKVVVGGLAKAVGLKLEGEIRKES